MLGKVKRVVGGRQVERKEWHRRRLSGPLVVFSQGGGGGSERHGAVAVATQDG